MAARKRPSRRKTQSAEPPLRVRWTASALTDLVHIGEYMAQGSAATARKWVNRLSDAPDRLATMPLSGRVVPEIGAEDTREVIVGQYRSIYRVLPNEVAVLGIASGKKRLPKSFWPPEEAIH